MTRTLPSKPRPVWIWAALVASFSLGAGLSLLYVLAHPIEVKSICAFMLPRAFQIPSEA
jgi:hypothetical protein